MKVSVLNFAIFSTKYFNGNRAEEKSGLLNRQQEVTLTCIVHCSAAASMSFCMVLLGMYNGYQQVMIFLQHTARKHSYICGKYDRYIQHCVNQDNNNTRNLGVIFLTFNKNLKCYLYAFYVQ